MKQKNEGKLYDDFINQLFPETLKGLAEGKIKPNEILNRDDLVSLGSCIDPEYPKLLEAAPVSEAANRVALCRTGDVLQVGPGDESPIHPR